VRDWSAATLGYIGARTEDAALRARVVESLVALGKGKDLWVSRVAQTLPFMSAPLSRLM
jgi:hypothetical protein